MYCLLSQGSIFESNAVARYVARMRRDSELCGVSFFESAQASELLCGVGGYVGRYLVWYVRWLGLEVWTRFRNDERSRFDGEYLRHCTACQY